MIRQAQKMQESMTEKQAELDALEYEFSAGGGMVSVKINGKKEILNISIKPELVDPEDVETLQDVIVAAVNEAYKSVESKNAARDGENHRRALAAGDVLMPGSLTPALERLAGRFASLPGIGRKSALRLAYHVLEMDESEVRAFADALLSAKESIHICPVCMNFCEGALCPICCRRVARPLGYLRRRGLEGGQGHRGFERIPRAVPHPARRNFAGRRHRAGQAQDQGTARAADARGARGDSRNESERGGRGDRHVSQPPDPPAGREGDAAGLRLPVGATLEYADGVTLLKAFEGRTEV